MIYDFFTIKNFYTINYRKNFTHSFNIYEIASLINKTFWLDITPNIQLATILIYEQKINTIIQQQSHPKQKLKYGQNKQSKYVDISIPIGRYREILGRILRYGPYGEFISPEDLRMHGWIIS